MKTIKFIHVLSSVGIALALNFLPSKAMANWCTRPYAMTVAVPGAADINPNAPDGSVLWTGSVKATPTPGSSCPAGTFRLDFVGTHAYLGNKLYDSGIPGIGYRLSMTNKPCNKGYWPVYCGPQPWAAGIGTTTLIIDLIKTGPITSRGELTGRFAQWHVNQNPNDIYATFAWAGSFVITPRVPTCSVAPSSTAISVPLGGVSMREFNGVGSSSRSQRNFNIELNCSGGDPNTSTNAYVTLTDASNPANTSQVLSLTPNSQASGVGVEILNGTTVLGYGPDSAAPGNTNQWRAGNIAVGTTTFTIPLSARYVQTSATVTPGTANAQAMFTMSYQ